MAVDRVTRLSSAVVMVLAFLTGAMMAMALGIDWEYIVVDQRTETLTITDLCETSAVKHKWTKSIYERCLTNSAAGQVGAVITSSNCRDFADRDSCSEYLRMVGHAVVAFSIVTFAFLCFIFFIGIAGFFLNIDLIIPTILFVVAFITSVLAWAPYVAYRYGEVPYCNDRRNAPWCPAGARKCRFYGFGFTTTVSCLCVIGVLLAIMMRRMLKGRAQPAATAKVTPQ